MDTFTILAIALGLSFDTFAVSLSLGVVRNSILFWQASRIAILLALVQGGMTVLGYFLGSVLSNSLKTTDHWVALVLLSFLGVKMIVEGIKKPEDGSPAKDFHNNLILLSIAFGTSIDAFAVGVSFAILSVQIWMAGGLIAMVTFMASMTAIRIGKSAGERLGSKVEVFGGLILAAIGIKIFLEHILAT